MNGGSGTVYGKPPGLRGYSFEPIEVFAARDGGRLLVVRLETNISCNLRCLYCRPHDGRDREPLSYDRLADLVREARAMGAGAVVLTGGEPMLLPRFGDLVDLIANSGMTPVVFSNCLEMTPKLARFLYQRGASVMAKLDSLKEELQDELSGVPGSARRMRKGIETLLASGFAGANDSSHLRLGASCVACRGNLDEIEDIWRFCRSNGIFPRLEMPTDRTRRKRLPPEQVLQRAETARQRTGLLDLDRREYGYDWVPYTPIAASSCLQVLAGLYVTVSGDVRPCESVAFDEHPSLQAQGAYPHNLTRRSLREIFMDPLFEQVRQVDAELEGECATCEHHPRCMGCRGEAYETGVVQGKDPREALRGESPRCLR